MGRHDDIYEGFIQGTNQLDPADSLAGEIGEDPLDAGYSPPDREPVATRWGNSVDELIRGESLDARLAQEQPDVSEDDLDEIDRDQRAGRLVAPDEGAHDDVKIQAIATDVGRAGWASSAEEAAMHIIEA